MSLGDTSRKHCVQYVSIIMLVISGYATAVPIEQSQPIVARDTLNKSVEVRLSDSETSSVSSGVSNTSTAYLINIIDQMREELMELRGNFEEQKFMLEQLHKDNRDRYLDLDDRISRLSQTNGKSAMSADKSSVSAPSLVKNMGGKSDSSMMSEKSDVKGEAEDYLVAFGFIRGKQFDKGRDALKNHLISYPKGQYADNVQYWLGEVEMVQGKYQLAINYFQNVLSNFPGSPKVPDASYKLGRLHDLLGEKKKARSFLESVIKMHPDTAAARLSDTYLRAMDGA